MKLQTTLLGFAIALIVVLVTALVGPMLIDWSTYRTLFETQACQLIGIDVRIKGSISVQLLPSPRATFQDITITDAGDAIHARSLGIELALGPLIRGVVRAAELNLDAPEITLNLDPLGHVRTPEFSISPDVFSIDRLRIENGKITLTDTASGERIGLDRISFKGEARSLFGPFKGEGAVTVGREDFLYRISTGRYEVDAFKIVLTLDPVARPLTLQAEGMLALAGATPRFDGSLTFSRPANILGHQKGLTQPWRMTGKVKATARSASINNIEFIYGSHEQGFNLTGNANVVFGREPQVDGALSSREINLDRIFSNNRSDHEGPLAVLGQLAEFANNASNQDVSIKLGIGVDQVKLGGDTLRHFQGNFSSSAHGWTLAHIEFRAPGFAEVGVSWRLEPGSGGAAFSGPMEITASDSKIFAAWLEGNHDSVPSQPRPLKLWGDVTLGGDGISVKNLNAEFAQQIVRGEFSLSSPVGQSSKLYAAIKANDLDLDAVLASIRALSSGSKFRRPNEITISAELDRVTIGDITGRNTNIRLKVDGTGVQIDHFSVTNFGGASFSANGHIAAVPSPRGNMHIDLDAPNPAPIIALLSRFFPETVDLIDQRVAALSPVKIHTQVVLEGEAQASIGKFSANGSFGNSRLTLNGQVAVDPTTYDLGVAQISGKLDAADGKELMAALGLDRVLISGSGPGALTFSAEGSLGGTLRLNGQLSAAGFEANANGTADIQIDNPSFLIDLSVQRADLLPYGTAQTAVPFSYAGRIIYANRKFTLSDSRVRFGTTNLRGKIEFSVVQPHRLQGQLYVDEIDGADLIASVIGMPMHAPTAKTEWSWPLDPFVRMKTFGDYIGDIDLTVGRIHLLSHPMAHNVRATMRLNKNEFSFDEINGNFAGGTLIGTLSFRYGEDGLRTYTKLSLNGATLAETLWAGSQSSGNSLLGLDIELEGTGTNPLTLAGSLRGAGKFTLTDAELPDLNPKAFDVATQAADAGIPIDQMHISLLTAKALHAGRLLIRRAEGVFTIDNGEVQGNNIVVAGVGGELSASARLNLTDGVLDTRLLLVGLQEAAGARPSIYITLNGPVASPSRKIDVSALIAWLTLRSVEKQTKKWSQ